MATHTFRSLVDAGLLEIGDGYRAKNNELGVGGPIFLRSAYLQDAGFVLNEPDRFSAGVRARFGSKIAVLDDVVITTKGNSTGRVGRIGRGEVGAVYSPHLSYWRSRDSAKIDQQFLYYWSRSAEFRNQLAGMSTSTDMAPYLSLRDQLSLRITIPPVVIQVRIGATLSALDEKIELNRRMNETLEAMAQAIFRDWFVDFGPVRRKVAGATDPVEVMGGVTSDPGQATDLAELFPVGFDDDGFPLGWRSEPVIDQAYWVNGAAYKKMHFVSPEVGLPVIKIAELKAGVTATTGFTNTNLGSRYRIDDGEVLFSWSGNPDTSIDTFIWAGGPAWLNQHIFAVRPNGKRSLAFLYALLKFLNPTFSEIARDKQTTGLGHVTKEDLKRLKVTVPTNGVEAAFDRLLTPTFLRLKASLLENRTLAETRDYLLPRLMSGQVRVADTTSEIAA